MSNEQENDKEAQRRAMLNRRRSVRLPPRQGISCTIIEGVEITGSQGQVLDVSQGGVRLMVKQRFDPGTYLNITLANVGDLFSYSSVVIVRYAVGASDGNHITGCEFLKPITYEELRALHS